MLSRENAALGCVSGSDRTVCKLMGGADQCAVLCCGCACASLCMRVFLHVYVFADEARHAEEPEEEEDEERGRGRGAPIVNTP